MDSLYGVNEISSVLQAAQAGARLDGRGFDEIMPVEMTTGVINQASGSVELRMGAIHLIAGVKARRLEEQGVAIAAVLQRLLLSRTRAGAALDLERLCIIPGKAAWALSIDCVIFAAGGGLVDALSIAIRAALADTVLPAVRVDEGIEDATAADIEVDHDATLTVDVSNLPVVVTACQLGERVCLGSTKVEEEAAVSYAHVAVNRKGQVCGLVKGGRSMMGFVALQNMIVAAQHAGPAVIDTLRSLPGDL